MDGKGRRRTARPARVFILSSGDELVRGLSRDTNFSEIAAAVTDAGLVVAGGGIVGDDGAELVRALRDAARHAEAVILTGGLGPTPDDGTRAAAARLLRVPLAEHRPTRRRIEGLWRERGLPMPSANHLQARLPRGARVVPNPVGSAPGFRFRFRGAEVFCLPGVPREMRVMLARTILPALRRLGGGASRTLRVSAFGLSESTLAERLGDLFLREGDLTVGTGVDEGILTVTIHGRGPAARRARGHQRRILAGLGEDAYAPYRVPLGEFVTARLLERGLTAATAESCTGGLAARRLTDLPGASGAFLGGVVAYDNGVKRRALGVSAALLSRHGAVSGPVAAAMARGARKRTGADLAVAITGVAGPGGGTKAKPVGTVWFAVASKRGVVTVLRRLPGDRAFLRGLAANTALDLLRREIDRLDPG